MSSSCSHFFFILLRFLQFLFYFFFFFNDTATTEIYTLSLHDALPILLPEFRDPQAGRLDLFSAALSLVAVLLVIRSEEHTSELQSRLHLVCRLLLEKKKKKIETLHVTMISMT